MQTVHLNPILVFGAKRNNTSTVCGKIFTESSLKMVSALCYNVYAEQLTYRNVLKGALILARL